MIKLPFGNTDSVTHNSVPHSQRHCDPECSASNSVVVPNSRSAPTPASADTATQSSSLNLSIYNTQCTSLATIPLEQRNMFNRNENAPMIAQREQFTISKIIRSKHTKSSRDQLNTAALLAVNKFENRDPTQNLPKYLNVVSVAPKNDTAIQSSSLSSKTKSLNPLRNTLALCEYQTVTYSTQHTRPATNIPPFSPRPRHRTSTSTQPLPTPTHQATPASFLLQPMVSLQERSPMAGPSRSDQMSGPMVSLHKRSPIACPSQSDKMLQPTVSLREKWPLGGPSQSDLRGKSPIAGPSQSDPILQSTVPLRGESPIAGPSQSKSTNHTPSMFTESCKKLNLTMSAEKTLC